MSGVLDRFRLDGRVAFVTGAARGLGLAIARALASAGAVVVGTSRDAAAATAAAAELAKTGGGRTLGFAVDVTQPDTIRRAVDGTHAAFGRLDILVNNAGTTRRGPIGDLTVAQWDEVLDTNLRGAWCCCQAAVPLMRAQCWGRIVNVSSMLGQVGLENRTTYIASKGGLTALTRALAIELAPDGITVNALCPGPFQTSMSDDAARARMLPQIPLGRWGDPVELGPAAIFLASEASSFMTGQTLTLDGGYTAR